MVGGEPNPSRARSNLKNRKVGQVGQAQSDVKAQVGKPRRKTVVAAFLDLENTEPVFLPFSNMERFLWATMPSVPAQFISKTRVQDRRTCNVDYQPYFGLDDLWESFKEWSAFGAGVPLVLNGHDYVVQYYVPYLSSIQIYVDPSKLPSNWSLQTLYSTGPVDQQKVVDFSVMALCFPRQGNLENESRCLVKDPIDLSPKTENSSLNDQQNGGKGGISKDGGGYVTPQGYLLYEYLESDSPFFREPLFDKINSIASCYPELKNLQSCDILSSSWVSVAWYPIYKIPTGAIVKDLEACFLTYHSLSTPVGDVSGEQAAVVTHPNDVPKIPLPSFGLSTYKYKESAWTSGSIRGQKLVKSLSEAAYDWLNKLQVQSPDYNFFASRR